MKKRLVSIIIVLILFAGFVPAGAVGLTALEAAQTLDELGLFRGTGGDYELERTATRTEALVMFVRLIGSETTALSGNYEHPFTDVSSWASGYVGYAYANSLTSGTGETTFGGGQDDTASAAHYITFVLRALGYSEEDGDFAWTSPWILSDAIGLTHGEYNENPPLTRGDMALISYNALDVTFKDGDLTLGEYLDIRNLSASSETPLTGVQIAEKASPAVFYIEVYASQRQYSKDFASKSGSGFFITADGVAVTNYHVVEGSVAARITLTDGRQYAVTHVIYADAKTDLAILRISRQSPTGTTVNSFACLEMADSDNIKNGATVYAIGSPKGMQNSISNGIISNNKRSIEGEPITYIQMTAPISSGSSGGPLLDEYARVIGINTATIEDAQNLNLSIPINLVRSIDCTAQGTEYKLMF